MRVEGFAQANKTLSGDITCPVPGSSIEVVAGRGNRYSILINNITSVQLRIGFLDGTSTANLTTANSWVIQPGQAWVSSMPGVLVRRIVCMSTGAAVAVTFNETYR